MANRVIVTDQQYAPMFLEWMTQRIGEPGLFEPDECRTIAHVQFNDDGSFEILCVVALNRWTQHSCEGNIASDLSKRWMTRDFAFTVYDFVFRHAGKSRFNFTVNTENADAIQMHEKLGHQFVCRLEDAYGESRDAFVYGLTKRQWLNGKYAKPSKQTRIPINTAIQTEADA